LSCLFTELFVPLIIKFPAFRSHYVRDAFTLNKSHHNFANEREAPVAVGITAGITLGVILIVLGVLNPGYHAFCGRVSETIVNFA
jgi:hypothetical protein